MSNKSILNYPGSADQILGVVHTGAGIEYKTLAPGTGITITPTAGSITISSSGFANPMTTLGDTIYGAASGVATRLAGNTTATKLFLVQTGTGSVSAAPAWAAIATADVPWATPGTIGSTTPSTGKFTTLTLTSSVTGPAWFGNTATGVPAFQTAQIPAALIPFAAPGAIGSTTANTGKFTTLTLTSTVAGGAIFANFANTATAPSWNSPGSVGQVLGVKTNAVGLEYKSIVAGPSGSITVDSTSTANKIIVDYVAGSAAASSFAPAFVDASLPVTADAQKILTHGLNHTPYLVDVVAICTTSDTANGYSVGAVIKCAFAPNTDTSATGNPNAINDGENFGMYVKYDASGISIIQVGRNPLVNSFGSNSGYSPMTDGCWHWQVSAW